MIDVSSVANWWNGGGSLTVQTEVEAEGETWRYGEIVTEEAQTRAKYTGGPWASWEKGSKSETRFTSEKVWTGMELTVHYKRTEATEAKDVGVWTRSVFTEEQSTDWWEGTIEARIGYKIGKTGPYTVKSRVKTFSKKYPTPFSTITEGCTPTSSKRIVQALQDVKAKLIYHPKVEDLSRGILLQAIADLKSVKCEKANNPHVHGFGKEIHLPATDGNIPKWWPDTDLASTLLHELIHTAGFGEGQAYACEAIIYGIGLKTPEEWYQQEKKFAEERKKWEQEYMGLSEWQLMVKAKNECSGLPTKEFQKCVNRIKEEAKKWEFGHWFEAKEAKGESEYFGAYEMYETMVYEHGECDLTIVLPEIAYQTDISVKPEKPYTEHRHIYQLGLWDLLLLTKKGGTYFL
jgi:hypothetical protein